jgi:pimeloyl-ACP methyl ester carboxylesterase
MKLLPSLLFCSACVYAFQPLASIAAVKLTMLPNPSSLPATAANEVAREQANGITFKAFSSTTQHSAPTQRLLYLPGIEGLGLSAEAAQFPELSTKFELYCMQINQRDRSTFAQLVKAIRIFLEDGDAAVPAVIVGESFGAVLALALAYSHPHLVQAVFTINPATSFPSSPWPTLGNAEILFYSIISRPRLQDELQLTFLQMRCIYCVCCMTGPMLVRAPSTIYKAAALVAFVVTIPDNQQIADVAGILLDPRTSIPLLQRPEALIRKLLSLWTQISAVSSNLPSETLGHRLQNWLIEV